MIFIPLAVGTKLHLGVDPDRHEVAAVAMTQADVGDW
jgi:hypothetical protein